MDSMQSFWKNASEFLKRVGLLGMPLLLLACASSPAQQVATSGNQSAETEVEKTAEAESEKDAEVEATLPFTPELMYYILTAEVAGQRGEIGAAVDLYHRAADMVESPKLASRSAQVASLSRDKQRISRALDRWVEVSPNEADVYIMQTPFLMWEEDFDGVVEAVNKALSLEPDKKTEYLARVSESLTEAATQEQALDTLERLELYQQGDPAAQFAHARLSAFYKQFDAALAEISPLVDADPRNEDYLILKADILQRMGRAEEGVKLIARAAKRKNASDELRFTYGKLLGDQGESEKARAVFEALHAEKPTNRDVLFALGLLALEDKDGQEAKSFFSQLLKQGDPTQQATYFMGLSEQMNGNLDAALVWFASVPVHSNRFDNAQNNYINILLERGELDKARAHLAAMRQDLPEQALQYYLFEASMLREADQSQDAFDLLTDAMGQYPQSEELRYSRAMIAESISKLDVLEKDLRWILEKDPNNAQALNALGYTLTDRTDRHQEALVMIQKALEIKPGDPFYLDSLGWAYYRLGELDKAEKYLREALQVQPDVEFIAHLGEVLWEKGKQTEAMKMWQQGLQQDADNRLLLDTMRRYGK
ncbi:tetratricopeptide repeat protein [Methylophaga thiooxydans]|uniref:tetratricopeptide repeat protein n=1 Tax=Methylophaga thiooxydans TaxID=392484 RepID=UPI002352C533|nr:tetratricopeptide repeat protein [Methylophaga thiooxydans]